MVIPYRARNVSCERARIEIMDYLKKYPGTDAYDIAIALELEPARTIVICNRLLKSGKLEVAASS